MGEVVVVPLAGEIDVHVESASSGLIREGATAALAGGADLVIDLTGVTFMDSAGFSALVRARKRLGADGHELWVRGAGPAIRRAMDLLGLSELLG